MAEVEHAELAAAEGDFVRCSLTARPGVDLRPQVFQLVNERGWKLRELTRSRHSLEDIFVRVTRADREEES
jgi:ABC-2 type transport system ATP-binding protein